MSEQIQKESFVGPQEIRVPESELMVACAAGWLYVVRRLIGAGVDTNHVSVQGETPLTYAATWGHESVVACLLAKGAKVDSPPEPAWTPLMYAASRGNRRIVLALLINGADPQRRDWDGRTAMDLARNAGHLDCVSLIKSWGRGD
jgi:ankyrin repeat protein